MACVKRLARRSAAGGVAGEAAVENIGGKLSAAKTRRGSRNAA